MNLFKKIYCRAFQFVLRIGMYFIHFPSPKLISGEDSILKVKDILVEKKINCVLIVTDNNLFSLGLLNKMLKSLDSAEEIKYVIYKDVVPNPTIDNIEEGLKLYKENDCKAIIAFGGGSPMDTAKGIGARVARPKKQISKMKGLLKVGKKLPLIIAIPTTAGTGSETTVAAVISNPKTHEKYPINDPKLVPQYAVLDPNLIVNLPGKITSTTGMDALTHAIEAYIGNSNTRKTKNSAILAVKLIFNNLEESYNNPQNKEARNNMLIASYHAGVAFTRAYVGYVHALAHTLGGFYGVPHGLANSILLPVVLEKFGDSAYKKLAELADLINLTDSSLTNKEKAEAFIREIKNMNTRMCIPSKIENIIKEDDIVLMCERADSEGNPLYPVPRLMGKKEFAEIIESIRG